MRHMDRYMLFVPYATGRQQLFENTKCHCSSCIKKNVCIHISCIIYTELIAYAPAISAEFSSCIYKYAAASVSTKHPVSIA